MEGKNLITLFSKEKLRSEQKTRSRPTSTDDAIINRKYELGQVRLITEQARYPLNTIVDMVESPRYILNPEFQRRHRWSNAKKSKLIESLIMNIPIPPIFLYEIEFSLFEVMDGLQRLTAIKQLYRDEFTLEGLSEWPELNGRRYSTLPTQVRAGIDRRYLSSIIILQETAKDADEAERLKQLVFERLNSGGEKLTPQESRNAIYNGKLNQLCIRLARDKYFCRLWNIPEPTAEELLDGEFSEDLLGNRLFKKMEDVEIVLRFFAYRQIQAWDGSIESFFDDYLQNGNNYSAELLKELSNLFESVIQFVYKVFGESAFWVYRKRKLRQPSRESWDYFNRPAKSVYDAMMYSMTLLLPQRERIEKKAREIKGSMPAFYEQNYQYFEGRNTNKSDVLERMNKLYEHINSFL